MSVQKLCPTCGTEYPANERFCPRDGTALRSQGSGNDLVGSIIAERYHVLKKLGEGGMGQVYLAEHVKMGRKSAVKVMNPGMVHDADAISRFNREASNASRINHPHVAGIYDFGETADGLIYLAMEFVEGEALTDIVKSQGALPAMRAARITKQAADGLQAAHDLGIVHRDLKPDNIMIGKNRDGSDCVKVVDFGIAKAAGSEAQNVTRTGMVVGTPEYMSPEQLSGDRLDGRSDVYSLALVAFNMLTGKLPFPSETVQESMIMRLTTRPQSLSQMNGTIQWPASVEQVMEKALERDAKLRYQSASQFGDALYDAIESMPKSAFAEGGTLVMGATPVPATMVSPAAAAAPRPAPAASAAPVAPRPSRTPVLVGGGVLAAAVLAGGVFFLKAPASTPENTGAAASTAAAAPAVPVAGGGAVAPSGAPASLPTGAGVPASGAAVAPPVAQLSGRTTGPAAPSGAARGAPASSAAVDVASRLPGLLEESASDATAARALATAEALGPRATRTSDLVGLGLVRAQALGMLGRDSEGCTVLQSIRGSANDTPYAARIAQLMKDSC